MSYESIVNELKMKKVELESDLEKVNTIAGRHAIQDKLASVEYKLNQILNMSDRKKQFIIPANECSRLGEILDPILDWMKSVVKDRFCSGASEVEVNVNISNMK